MTHIVQALPLTTTTSMVTRQGAYSEPARPPSAESISIAIHYLSLHLCLASTEEPPTKEAHEAPDDNDGCNSNACDGAGRKAAALVDTRRYALRPVVVGVEARATRLAPCVVARDALGAVCDSAVGRGLFSALRGEGAHQEAEN